MFAFSSAFYALLLCNVLFLTAGLGLARSSTAGFAVTPGPLMAARHGSAGGTRWRIASASVWSRFPGALLFATRLRALRHRDGQRRRAYASEYLGPTLLTGAGVGLSFAAWGSAAVAELPGALRDRERGARRACARSARCWA